MKGRRDKGEKALVKNKREGKLRNIMKGRGGKALVDNKREG